MDMKSLYLALLATATVPASSWASQCQSPGPKWDLHFGKYYRVRDNIFTMDDLLKKVFNHTK